jgi:hypothetical protein
MEEYTVIKRGESILHCIQIPDDFVDKDLEIRIRPVTTRKNLARKVEALLAKYADVNPFDSINDSGEWQREIRGEW